MTVNNSLSQDHNKNCLTDDDLFLYISRTGDSEKLGRIEAHCAGCPDCRRALAEVLGILQTDHEQTIGEFQESGDHELEKTLDLIHDVARKERSRLNFVNRRLRWPVAAVLLLGFTSLAFWGLKSFYERNKSEEYYLQAKLILEQHYSERSPSNLRLNMPFNPAPMARNTDNTDSLRRSENLFYQALAVRENMIEARLGLAYINLTESKFSLAEEAFQEVLDYRKGEVQALIGRGVARYEEALQSNDPMEYHSLLNGALDDFNEALKNDPDSSEARYNKVWVLFDSGLHEEALHEIEQYLSQDKESVWAEELKGLRVRIRAGSAAFVNEEVHKAARTRDPYGLEEIARYVPYQMPAAIWATMRKSLALENAGEIQDNLNAEDLKWTAGIMESAYRKATGDHSFRQMLDYYKGLLPQERTQKKTLDELFQNLAKLQESREYRIILLRSDPLKQQYLNLQDIWQLYNLHNLRGQCFYMCSEYGNACEEFLEMLRLARRLDSPELIARSLVSVAAIKSQQRKFDDSMDFAGELREIVDTHGMDSWRSYVGVMFGYQYIRLGQYDQSLKESISALKSAYRFSDASITAEALENIGTAMDRLGRLQEAESFYDSALQRVENHLSDKPDRGITQLTLRRSNLIYEKGDLSLRLGIPDDAISYFQNSLKSITSDMLELEASNRIGLVEAFLKKKQSGDAAAMLKRVMGIDVLEEAPEVEWKAWFFHGRLLEEREDYSGALVSYRKAIEIIEGIRSDIDSTNLRRSFFSDRFDPYKVTIDLLYRYDGDRQSSLEYVDRAKSMTLREYLELPDAVHGMGTNSDKIEDKEDPFRILEYFFSQDRLLVFVTGHEGRIIETAPIELSPEIVDGQVQEFIKSIRENDIKRFNKLSRQLYDELFSPIEQHALRGYSGPVIVLPDGPLHLLPFAGLRDEQGRFLIEKNPVVYAPSRSVFRRCLELGRTMPAEGKQDVVLIDGTADLSNARDELLYLSNLYGSNARVLGSKDLQEFREAVAGSEILHFSGHAVSKQGKPVLLLQRSPQEAYLDSREISSWKLQRCRLVNLAGCNTGIGPISEGESPWGLVPEFLNAGTPAIVASLMQVDDASTNLLTRRFYESLQNGADKATALQKAQTALLNQSKDTKSLSWLPYILIGDPL